MLPETTPGVFRCYDNTLLKETIKEEKEKSDYVVLLIHWGKEDSHELEEVIKVTGKEYIDEGADLIIGSHAHLLQGMEIYNNKLIAYNLGDFIFNRETKDTGILSVTLNKKGNLSYKFIPCKQDNYKTSLLEGKEKDRVLNNMNSYSINVIFNNDGIIKTVN
ncbi:MAG: CapA family protein [Candidatus Gastranaerophilaceae bacterium]